jgi:hypothetical protein
MPRLKKWEKKKNNALADAAVDRIKNGLSAGPAPIEGFARSETRDIGIFSPPKVTKSTRKILKKRKFDEIYESGSENEQKLQPIPFIIAPPAKRGRLKGILLKPAQIIEAQNPSTILALLLLVIMHWLLN